MKNKSKKAREVLLKKMFSIIRKNPGIRPSKLNKILKSPHTANLRNTLLKRKLIMKKRKRNAVHYYQKTMDKQ